MSFLLSSILESIFYLMTHNFFLCRSRFRNQLFFCKVTEFFCTTFNTVFHISMFFFFSFFHFTYTNSVLYENMKRRVKIIKLEKLRVWRKIKKKHEEKTEYYEVMIQ